MKKFLKILSEICKWITLFPKIVDIIETTARNTNKDDSTNNSNTK